MPGSVGAVLKKTELNTRLSRWHPYPAMVPDELAIKLAKSHVTETSKVLDPFCGSGRFLMASAALGADCVGYDVNPLACILTAAKAANPRMGILETIAKEAANPQIRRIRAIPISLRSKVKVQWFSDKVASELAAIIKWINRLDLTAAERLIVAASLSAATRDAAWIRKSGWKLHRVSEPERNHWNISAWDRFAYRLTHYINDSCMMPILGNVKVQLQHAHTVPQIRKPKSLYDVILTSPPYGDSYSTVQYGGASGICLDVVSRIHGLEDSFSYGHEIDTSCLGGMKNTEIGPIKGLRKYWAGSSQSDAAIRISHFLKEYALSCKGVANSLKPGGKAIYVVGRRSVEGFRLKLDLYTEDQFLENGMRLLKVERRKLREKRLPSNINRFARANSEIQRIKGNTKTMDEEIVLLFQRS